MTTNENAHSNISQLMASLDTFIQIIEDPFWAKSASVEDIKTAFKLGHFIEKVVKNYADNECLFELMRLGENWWKKNGRTKKYHAKFFEFSCDELLKKFFVCDHVSGSSLDISVRVYTSIYSRERLQKVVKEILLSAGVFDAVCGFLKFVPNTKKSLQYKDKLNYWTELVETGREEDMKSELKEMLSLYKIETDLCVLIGIVSLNLREEDRDVQNVVLESVLEKMAARNLLAKSFWLTLFNKVDTDVVCDACKNCEKFLNSFLNFIVYIGSMMVQHEGCWKSNESVSICPEITYSNILTWLKTLCKNEEVKETILLKLQDAKNDTEHVIWDELREQLVGL